MIVLFCTWIMTLVLYLDCDCFVLHMDSDCFVLYRDKDSVLDFRVTCTKGF